MVIKYRNLEVNVNVDSNPFDVLVSIAPSLIRNKNLKQDGTLTYEEEIDESLIEFIAETPEEHLFLLNSSLETNKPQTIDEVNKLIARKRVAEEVGDIYDLVSDLSKRLTMSERLLIRFAKDMIVNGPEHVPTINLMYADLVDSYLAMQEAYQNQTNIADLEDPMLLFQKLFERSIATTQIVKTEYLDKKETTPTE